MIAACPCARQSIIHSCLFLSLSRRATLYTDGAQKKEKKLFLRLYDIHLSALHDGAPSVQLENFQPDALIR